MEDLTFGEQVKIVLGRKGMTIKELAETIEKETGKKMSRQNLTQRLGRDNFQEQDMRLIASILGCPFQLSIMSGEIAESAVGRIRKQEVKWNEQEQPEESFSEETMETEKEEQQLTDEELAELEKNAVEAEPTEDVREDLQTEEEEYKEELQEVPESDQEEENSVEPEVSYTEDYDQPAEEEAEPYEEAEVTSYETQPAEPVQEEATYEEPVQEEVGDINPYTGREYESNSVRMHPKRIGYVQVYDRASHKWTDMTEWAFLGYQERKKVLLGEDYEPPIYLD